MLKPCARRLIALLVVLGVASTLHALGKRVAIEREDLVGVWIGLTTDDLELVRLDLSATGDAVLGYTFMDREPCIVAVRAWTFGDGALDLVLGHAPECAGGRQFSGVVAGNTVSLVIRGDGWKRRAVLKRESPLVSRWDVLKAAMMVSVDADR